MSMSPEAGNPTASSKYGHALRFLPEEAILTAERSIAMGALTAAEGI